jgi:hypothetical protein
VDDEADRAARVLTDPDVVVVTNGVRHQRHPIAD